MVDVELVVVDLDDAWLFRPEGAVVLVEPEPSDVVPLVLLLPLGTVVEPGDVVEVGVVVEDDGGTVVDVVVVVVVVCAPPTFAKEIRVAPAVPAYVVVIDPTTMFPEILPA